MASEFQYMGIVNATDDSYFSASRVCDPESFITRVRSLVESGASIIDIGACSTRPGFTLISEAEEWSRLSPLLTLYREHFAETALSIDTFRSEIVIKARKSLGFDFIVNDITSGEYDRKMLSTVGRLGMKYIAMHHKGSLMTMHNNYDYDNIVNDVISYFRDFEAKAENAGIKEYIIDPGFGFSKRMEDNITLLKNISELQCLCRPVLIGISRKSFIYKPLGLGPDDDKVLKESLEWERYAVSNGVSILRVHEIVPFD